MTTETVYLHTKIVKTLNSIIMIKEPITSLSVTTHLRPVSYTHLDVYKRQT